MRGAASALALALALALATAGCAGPVGAAPSASSGAASQEIGTTTAEERAETQQPEGVGGVQGDGNEEEAGEMRASIGGTDVSVAWEGNRAVTDLRALAAEGPVTVELSMYGGFEQVGPLGTSLTASDVQMTTEPGDIVLYAGSQISVFYGQNSWAYTKLGHVTDRTADEMADLLGNGDVSITIAIQ